MVKVNMKFQHLFFFFFFFFGRHPLSLRSQVRFLAAPKIYLLHMQVLPLDHSVSIFIYKQVFVSCCELKFCFQRFSVFLLFRLCQFEFLIFGLHSYINFSFLRSCVSFHVFYYHDLSYRWITCSSLAFNTPNNTFHFFSFNLTYRCSWCQQVVLKTHLVG